MGPEDTFEGLTNVAPELLLAVLEEPVLKSLDVR
jgi:hypothetical protein